MKQHETGYVACYASFSWNNSNLIQRTYIGGVDGEIQCYGLFSCSDVGDIWSNFFVCLLLLIINNVKHFVNVC